MIRGTPESWAELERRAVFDRREMRLIRRERIRRGIREQALFCFMGQPEDAVALTSPQWEYPMTAYVYADDDQSRRVVYVAHAPEASIVIGSFESTRDLNHAEIASVTLSCSLRVNADWTTCRLDLSGTIRGVAESARIYSSSGLFQRRPHKVF
jgi:hypothetical protein